MIAGISVSGESPDNEGKTWVLPAVLLGLVAIAAVAKLAGW